MPLPHVIIVGADKGGVGKTTVANALMDFFRERGVNVKAWDTESPLGNLVRFWPAQTDVTDLEHTDGQMPVFDSLMANPVTLIDMRAGILTDTVKMLHDLGCVRLAQEGKIRLSVLHVIGSSIASIAEVKKISAALGDNVRHFVVINHHTDNASFFANMSGVDKAGLDGSSVVINIPKLTTRAYEHMDAAGLPPTAFSKDEKQSFTMRGYVNDWTQKVFLQFDGARLAVPV
jgi:MinD-like ATPase involved in chromosome partitioning or flagellar assembly